MKKYLIAAVLVGAFTVPAFAAMMPGAGPYYVGLDTTTHKCSVVRSMATGMKRMGKFRSQAAAQRAMSYMNQCSALRYIREACPPWRSILPASNKEKPRSGVATVPG